MIFRATMKVSSKLRIAYTDVADSHPSMLEWYCNLITVRRRQFFLFTHGSSLFSFWAPAAGSTRDSFGQVFRQHAIDTLRDYGFSNADTAKVIDDGPDTFAKPADRGVTGSMVDYAKMLRHAVDYDGSLERLGPRAMNDIANDSPMRKIGMESPAQYLRQVLRAERPHNITVHPTGARDARPGLIQKPVTASQSKAPEDLAGVRAAAERFLRALDDLDWEPFRTSWASEPTVFFPFGDTPDRVIGRTAVETRWRRFFEEMRARRPGPPYLHLKPRDLRVERLGDVGLVTFVLDGLSAADGRQLPLQRRTLLFIWERETWKLVHLHASAASQP